MLMLKCSKRAGCHHVHGDPGRGCTSQIVLETFNVRTRHVANMLKPQYRKEVAPAATGVQAHLALLVRDDFCLKVVF